MSPTICIYLYKISNIYRSQAETYRLMMDAQAAYTFQPGQPGLSLFCPALAESLTWGSLATPNGAHVSLPTIVPVSHRMPPAMPPLHPPNSVNNETAPAPPNANNNSNNNNNHNDNNNNSSSNANTGDLGHSSSCGAESPVAENEPFIQVPSQAPGVPPPATTLPPEHIGLIQRLPPSAAINLAAYHANASNDIQASSVEAAAAAAVAVAAAELTHSVAQAAHYHTHVHHQFHRNHLPPAPAIPHSYISVLRPELFHPEYITAATIQPFHPYYLQTPLGRHGRFDEYIRHLYHSHRHAPQPNRGATKTIIERNTFAHKYKRMKKTIDEEKDDDIEKCTICLYELEVEEDVRYVEEKKI